MDEQINERVKICHEGDDEESDRDAEGNMLLEV